MINHKAAALRFYEIAGASNTNLKKPQEHFVSCNWQEILDISRTPDYNSVLVYEDFSCLLYWLDKIGSRKNVAFFHPDKNIYNGVKKQGINAYMELSQIPKNVPQVGNPAFSIAEDVYLSLPSNQEVCMVMPAWLAVAPNWKAQGWGKKQEVKRHIESIGLKELLWIPNGSFTQYSSGGQDTAQVDSVLVITEPNYTGDVKVTNLNTGSSYLCSRGGIYPRSQSTLCQIDRFNPGNSLKFREDQEKDNVLDEWAVGVGIYNPFAKSKGANGYHLKGMMLYPPGSVIKKNTCFEVFGSEKEAKDIFSKITDEKTAAAYQDLTTQKSFSSIMFRMLTL